LKGQVVKRTTTLASVIGVLAFGAVGNVVVANAAQAKSHAHTAHAQPAPKTAHGHTTVHSAETAQADGPGGHEDIGDNVDHQFDGSE
jgi:hypothetical protein